MAPRPEGERQEPRPDGARSAGPVADGSGAAGRAGNRAPAEGDARTGAHVKRFYERWMGDDRFRDALLDDPGAAVAALGLDVDPEALAFLWRGGAPPAGGSPEAGAWQRIHERGRAYLDFCADDGGAPGPWRPWRTRQRARCAFALGTAAPMNLHLPFAVELTRGCSLRCWFCGVSAQPLAEVPPTDLVAWERMLGALGDMFGSSAARGVLYWATDPLDHPDYEAHAEVFRRLLGRFPNTTTAAPLADPARTRRLLAAARSRDYPYAVLRFSAVTRRRLEQIHAEFSAEELADVDLIALNRESVLALAETGHARAAARRRPELAEHERDKLRRLGADPEHVAHRTIACVSGFLIEPAVGRVRLISPEPCSDRWPDGYVVFGEERYEDAGGFARAIDRLAARHMTPDPPARLALQRGVTVAAEDADPRAARAAGGGGHAVTFRSQRGLGHLPALADAFRGGARVEDAVGAVAGRFGVEPRLVRLDVTALWRRGVLIEPVCALADAEETP